MVFDAGNDSAANQDHLAELGLHFVGSLVVSQHPDLLAIPASRYQIVDQARFGGLTAVETTAEALGRTRRVIVTHSPTFHARQTRGFGQTLAKAERQLFAFAARLARGHTRRLREQAEAEINQITAPRAVLDGRAAGAAAAIRAQAAAEGLSPSKRKIADKAARYLDNKPPTSTTPPPWPTAGPSPPASSKAPAATWSKMP